MRHVSILLAACLLVLCTSAAARTNVGVSIGRASGDADILPGLLVRRLASAYLSDDPQIPPTYGGQFLRRSKLLQVDATSSPFPPSEGVGLPLPEVPGAYYSPPIDGQPPGYGNDTGSGNSTLPGDPNNPLSPGEPGQPGAPGTGKNSTSHHNTTSPPPPTPVEIKQRQQEKQKNEQRSQQMTGAAAATASTTVVATSTMSAVAGAAAGNVAATAVGSAATTAVAGGAASAAATTAVAGAGVGASAGVAAGSTAAGAGVGVSSGLAGSGATAGISTGAGGTVAATGGGSSAVTTGAGSVTQLTSSTKLAQALDINQYMTQGPLVTMFHHMQMIQLLSDGLASVDTSTKERSEFVQFYRDVSGSLEWVVFRYRDECLQRGKYNGTAAQANCLWRAGKGQAIILGAAFVACLFMHTLVLLLFYVPCCRYRWQPPSLLAFPNPELLLMSVMVIPVTQCACYLLSAGILGGLTKAYIAGGLVVGFLLVYITAVLTIVSGVVNSRGAWGLTYVLNPFARSFRSSSVKDPNCSLFAVVSGGCHVDLSQWHGSWNVDDVMLRGLMRSQYVNSGGGFLGFVSRAIAQHSDHSHWRKERHSYVDLRKSSQFDQRDTTQVKDQQAGDSPNAVIVSGQRGFVPDMALRVEMDDRLGAVYLDYKGETALHSSWHIVRLMYQIGIAGLLASSRVSPQHSRLLLWCGGLWQLGYAVLVLVIQPYCNRWFGLLESLCHFLQTANVFILALMASTTSVNVSKEIFLYISLSSVAVTMLGSWLRIVAMFWRIEGLYFVIKRPRVLQQLHSITSNVAPCTTSHFKNMEDAADELETMRMSKMAVELDQLGQMPAGLTSRPVVQQGAGHRRMKSILEELSHPTAAQPYPLSGHVELPDVHQGPLQPPHHRPAYR